MEPILFKNSLISKIWKSERDRNKVYTTWRQFQIVKKVGIVKRGEDC